MTKTEFEEFVEVEIPSALFHVMPTDLDDESGANLDEIILIRLLNENPQALRYKSLAWFVGKFLN